MLDPGRLGPGNIVSVVVNLYVGRYYFCVLILVVTTQRVHSVQVVKQFISVKAIFSRIFFSNTVYMCNAAFHFSELVAIF